MLCLGTHILSIATAGLESDLFDINESLKNDLASILDPLQNIVAQFWCWCCRQPNIIAIMWLSSNIAV